MSRTITLVVGMVAIACIEMVALATGHDGLALAGALAAIASMAGVHVALPGALAQALPGALSAAGAAPSGVLESSSLPGLPAQPGGRPDGVLESAGGVVEGVGVR